MRPGKFRGKHFDAAFTINGKQPLNRGVLFGGNSLSIILTLLDVSLWGNIKDHGDFPFIFPDVVSARSAYGLSAVSSTGCFSLYLGLTSWGMQRGTVVPSGTAVNKLRDGGLRYQTQ
ncbi:hypothetical protein F4810DRAFT_708015 [Camillea tinctor]|nr:hypothetical protein F4810DRAFT_708015 [Camillea tinctor]